ncbi:conserved hypothetical protein [Histoplasma capsulatum H143]|uniref:N-acetyltransferase domain-containing protein n=1 Tax=Ajellomyces capsulatus (strain H143) TaxID=544712 RepID=C6HEM4_AJECH|nr:conserved hypothetical protein [Histoplasma capsulatum H143]
MEVQDLLFIYTKIFRSTNYTEVHDLAIVRGTVDDSPAVLHLLDIAVKWLESQGRTGQWGTALFSENLQRVEQFRELATTGQGLWLAVKVTGDTPIPGQDRLNSPTENGGAPRVIVGALALGEKMSYVAPVSEPELYVRLLVTDRRYAGSKIGTRLLEHARDVANKAGALLLRLDCYAGGDGKLVQFYESQGFKRFESFKVKGEWPCQVLAQRLDEGREAESG